MRAKYASVVGHLQYVNDSYQWDVDFIRLPHNCEVEFFFFFWNQFYAIWLRKGGEDKP